MNRKARSKVVKDGDKIKITLDEQTIFEVDMIVFLLMEMTRKPLTEEQARRFIDCLRDKCFAYNTDIDVAKFEESISGIYELLEYYCGEIARGV